MQKIAKEIPVKVPFDIKVETMVPAILTYRIMAETPEEAVQLLKNQTPRNISYKLNSKKDIKLSVYDVGSCILRLIKNLTGR